MASRKCSTLRGLDWSVNIQENPNNTITVEPVRIQAVLLWEILQELKQINERLSCAETLSIPRLLRAINRKTPNPTRKPRTP